MSTKIKIAINGFGRIGRAAFKTALNHPEIEVAGINDLGKANVFAHLLKYDSAYGPFNKKITAKGSVLTIDGKKYPLTSEKDPSKLPWKKLGVDVVLECTGRFTNYKDSSNHLKAGAKKVIISAPAKDKRTPIFMPGVNEKEYKGEKVINMGSCTTNCIAPIMKVMCQKFGVLKSLMTTVHSYTSDQRLLDNYHQDLRRARTAAANIVPTTTGAAIATAQALPELNNLFDGMALRVPTPVVSLADITLVTKKKVTQARVNQVFRQAAASKDLKKIIAVTNKPLVSSDFISDTHSAIIDLSLTKVIDKDLVKITAWYDNEWGYSNRLVEMVSVVGK
ncbi:type I glyceraldehyde-3-phosphate dehydrogenase [Patescibacteria group bacterium]|nr:type I glyceraldehyde-3-phosphate dehydrogenase [Patescibacteria group bacterium]